MDLLASKQQIKFVPDKNANKNIDINLTEKNQKLLSLETQGQLIKEQI